MEFDLKQMVACVLCLVVTFLDPSFLSSLSNFPNIIAKLRDNVTATLLLVESDVC